MNFEGFVGRMWNVPHPFIATYGVHNSGKTDFSLRIAEIGLEKGLIHQIGTNISSACDGETIIEISSIDKLKSWVFREKNVKKLFILDEAGVHADRRNPLARINKELRHFGFTIRKYHGKIAVISQRLKDIESTFVDNELTVAVFKKVAKKRAIVNSFLIPERKAIINHIKATNIPFNTYDVAPFTLHSQNIEGEMKGLCCWVAKQYIKHGNFSAIGKLLNTPLKAQQVKRLLQQHLRHTFRDLKELRASKN